MQNQFLSKNKKGINIILFIGSFLVSFFLLEILTRYIFPPPPVPRNVSGIYNFADYKIYDTGLVAFDEDLGWVNKPYARGYGMFGEYLSFDSMGFRENGNTKTLRNRPVILAIGDSYTLGVEVDNADTWPSRLELKSGIKVLNGGVGGYGLDQMLTRTTSVLKKMTVDYVIVAFILEDIHRVKQIRQYSILKPHYTLQNNNLVSSKVKLGDYPPTDYFKKILGYSYVVHLFMTGLFKDYWSKGGISDMAYADIDEMEVSFKIIDAFVNLAEDGKLKGMIFIALPSCYGDLSLVNHPVTQHIKKITEKNSRVFLIDMQTDLLNIKIFQGGRDAEIHALFNDSTKGYHGHFSKAGNDFVAQEILSLLRSVKAYP